ncbi:MAG: class II aldolase/adducin family protein [Gammaproteobacteria bacterium]
MSFDLDFNLNNLNNLDNLNPKAVELKQNLAWAYRIIAHLGLDDHTYTHLSSRSPNTQDNPSNASYYIYPFGLCFEEVKPQDLLEVSLDGQVLFGQEQAYNATGFVIHGAIYQARADIQHIFHLHTPATVAVSAMAAGLEPLSQWALHFYGKLAYYDYDALALDPQKHGADMVRALGEHQVLFLRHHGIITCGKTPWEALFYAYHLEKACITQCLIAQSGRTVLEPSQKACEQAVHDLLNFELDLGRRDWEAWIRILKKREKIATIETIDSKKRVENVW